MPRKVLAGRGWFCHRDYGNGIISMSGPWPCERSARARAEYLAGLFNDGKAIWACPGQEAKLPTPRIGRRWFLEGVLEEGAAACIGPFHSRKAALSQLGSLKGVLGDGAVSGLRAVYQHDPQDYQRTWVRRHRALQEQLEATQRTLNEVVNEKWPDHLGAR